MPNLQRLVVSIGKAFNSLASLLGIPISIQKLRRSHYETLLNVYQATTPLVVFDVGAFRGLYAKELLQVFAKSAIWCYEPNPSEFGRLTQLAFNYSSVTALNMGLSDSKRADYIHINRGTASSSLLPLDDQAAQIWGTDALTPNTSVNIQLTTGDSEFDRLNLSHIDILKIDAQGHEINVLKGFRSTLANRLIANIYLEVLVAPSYQGQPSVGELISFVESSGFRLVGIFNEYFSTDGLLLQFDALFTLHSRDKH